MDEWIDVEDWNLRHARPGEQIRQGSFGAVETDWRGAVVRVRARPIEGRQMQYDRDPETGEEIVPGRMVTVTTWGEPPTREDLLAIGYQDRATFPLDDEDAADEDVSFDVLDLGPDGGEETPPEAEDPALTATKDLLRETLVPAGDSKVAPVTRVEPRPRATEVAPEPEAAPASASGEMGVGLDLDSPGDPAEAPTQPAGDAEGYESPFSEGGAPEGASATDPRHEPHEEIPSGPEAADAVKRGAADVIDA